MTPQSATRAARTYKVNSLDRGLDVLRVIRNADGPVRNNDIVLRTGLPKATVSRLVHTLTVMGYLRRIDQGSYVLGQASGRTGRAMIEGLRLERHAHLFADLVIQAGAYATLGMRVHDKVVPVFRWSAGGSILITSGVDIHVVDDVALMTACCLHASDADADIARRADVDPDILRQLDSVGWCAQWSPQAGQFTACASIRLGTIGSGVLTFHIPQHARLSETALDALGRRLLDAAQAIASEAAHP